ncbi:EGF domain-specific O-linked N-acetylglucosamine transferase-like [Tigriopus californicus]|uniref:EGF domain-specific O-linked N-acetylglucosamine transferase-like n=1 Tax=Tigriopus californicus TaxID=6832 RepID=UPI0027DA9951|nr:EGF domain-specific O-linked N-acetylglucosamine transferase-like [Tigriopus californicus]|eukprot:TCALIF_04152-PA protein Name:"Similar to Eogt EGF domain-specific O-linked N-acetylglucosamine transferase (Drosophila melanogaster)" AED:0.21 eAED:0.21 QI:0/-1/0/1/-1/1/1/0/509
MVRPVSPGFVLWVGWVGLVWTATGPPFRDWNLPKAHLERSWGHRDACWGHEPDCSQSMGLDEIQCQPEYSHFHKRPAKSVFDDQSGFGYLRKMRSSVRPLCRSAGHPASSNLNCSDQLTFCQGRNLMIDFRPIMDIGRTLRYDMDVLKEGGIHGRCTLNRLFLQEHSNLMSPLQSWAPEVRYFQTDKVFFNGTDSRMCDVYVERPTILMKLDATVNMYHHFCDFFNLYLSLHLNGSDRMSPEAFSTDINILIWENIDYHSSFRPTFQAFTQHPLLDLRSFGAQRVCFRKLMLPALPRLIFGLYYNTPIIQGCRNSALFRAFSEFILHRLRIPERVETDSRQLRVTLLSRLTKHRRIINQEQLVAALNRETGYHVEVAYFTHKNPFEQQLRTIHSTDILIGLHGAGLTHMFFLPPWATVFELYNCEDAGCYQDLTHLCGLNYITWTNRTALFPQSEDPNLDSEHKGQPKFNNYAFDPLEFVRKVNEAGQLVRNHPQFQHLDPRFHSRDEL